MKENGIYEVEVGDQLIVYARIDKRKIANGKLIGFSYSANSFAKQNRKLELDNLLLEFDNKEHHFFDLKQYIFVLDEKTIKKQKNK